MILQACSNVEISCTNAHTFSDR
ncbi:unnamed protein product [Lasius platythorax]|uniref:Uncharacterized protein n=1 Tax=Lasius platythorax TaxID=488582 RepID=A0AAV2N4J7_9HYME